MNMKSPLDQPRKISYQPWLLAVMTLIAFSPLFMAEFCSMDDPQNIWQNPLLNPPTLRALGYYWTHEQYGLYVPLTYTVWAALARIAQVSPDDIGVALNPLVFHAANLGIHVLSVLIAYQLLLKLLRNKGGAFIGAALFALHPLQVEPVAWAAGLKDVLAGMFVLLAIWQYVEFSQNSRNPSAYVLATSAFVLAMLAKPSALVAPLIVAAIDRWLVGRTWRDVMRALWPWAILSLGCAIVGRISQPATGVTPAPLWARPWVVGDALTFYLFKFIWPFQLAVDYGRTPARVMAHAWFYLTWLIPVLLFMIVWVNRRSWPAGFVAMLVFIAALLPTSGLVTFLFQYYSTTADHYMYVAMLGPALAVASLSIRHQSMQKWIVAVVGLLGILSFLQSRVWQEDVTLFEHSVKINPNGLLALNNLAHAYDLRGQPKLSEPLLQKAVMVYPDDATSHRSLGGVLAELGRFDESIDHFLIALRLTEQRPPEIQANLYDMHEAVGRVFMEVGKWAEAREHFEAALKLRPDDPTVLEDLRRLEGRKGGPQSKPVAQAIFFNASGRFLAIVNSRSMLHMRNTSAS